MGEHPFALIERRQPERRGVRLEVADWMGIEGSDDHRPPLVRAALHGSPDHRLVAKMEAIEIAKRDDRAAKLLRDRLVMEQALHCCRRNGWSNPRQSSEKAVLQPPTYAMGLDPWLASAGNGMGRPVASVNMCEHSMGLAFSALDS
jgi:hypothetical protein